MKEFLTIGIIFLIIIAQIIFGQYLKIGPAVPFLGLIIIVNLILLAPQLAIFWTVAIGILLDLFTPIRFGSTTIALLVIYFLLQPLRQKYILNPNFYLVGLLTLPCTIIAQTLMIILNHFSFSWGLFYDGLYNALLATIFFFVLVKIFPPKGTIPVKIKV